MAEQVIINIVPGECGSQYIADTTEATMLNEMYAREIDKGLIKGCIT